jgi:tetratricopeptide (TPR) repeat protein
MAIRSFLGLFLAALILPACGASAVPAPTDASVEASNRNAAELYHRGEQAAEQGDTVRAEQYLSMALDRGFDEKKVLPIMLRVCLSSSRLRAALNHAEPYLREHPNDKGLRYLVATIYLSLGQLDDARIELNHLLRLDAKNADAYYLLGVLESGSNAQQAPAPFRKYLELAPQGERAVEVRSRLTDLSVRVALSQSVAMQGDPIVVPRAEPMSESSAAPKPASSNDAAWFANVTESTGSSTQPVGAQ